MPSSTRFRFLLKVGLALSLAAAFDWLFPNSVEGVSVGLFALAWLTALILGRREVRVARLDVASALACAAISCAALAYDPGLLAWVIFWCALSLAALLPRRARFDDAWRWLIRLSLHGLIGIVKPLIDIAFIATMRPRGKRLTLRTIGTTLAFPLIGTAIFIALFANANPVIADMLDHIRLPAVTELLKWIAVILAVWPALRPHRLVTRIRIPEPRIALPDTSVLSALIALFLFNAVFALENGLDVAFLWSGAALPSGMSMTEYVHRGAYPLIATALLAGFFVLTMLRPGTATAANKGARRLVALWIAQNLFLVASSALRTIRYIEEYELTAWRIAALAWMGLVAAGLILICWRIWFSKSARWLINANALAAAVLLVPCCFVDLDAIAAQWNVHHAREVGGTGQNIDLCYLRRMGAPALLPLIQLEKRPLSPDLHDRVLSIRMKLLDRLGKQQSHWWSWTPHGAVRLAQARTLIGVTPPPFTALHTNTHRTCDGSIMPDLQSGS